MPSASTTLPLLGAAVSSLAGASAFQVPTATALQRTAVGSSAALSAAGRFSVPLVSQAAHLWTSKHGRVRVPPGFGRLRGGQLSSYRMAASDLASQAESATNATPVEQRLGQLRSSLSDKNLDALLVLAGDAHHSEYPSERDRCMRYISGFTGSAGTILVPAQGDEAFLVTDGRYTIQAGQELDGNIWRVMQTGARLPTLAEHLKSALGETAKKVAVDASTCSLETWRVLEKDMAPHTLVALDNSPLGMQWERDSASPRPSMPTAVAVEHPVKYAGVSAQDKLAKLREDLRKHGAEAMAISSLDEVAWLLNIRGSDIAYCPVVVSYAVVTSSEAYLFIDESKLGAAVRVHVQDAGYTIKPYHQYLPTVRSLAGLKFWVDPAVTSWATYQALGYGGDSGKKPHVEKLSPMALPKAVKNSAEIAGLKEAHIRDGVAMARFFSWLEAEIATGKPLDEVGAADQAERERKRVGDDMFRGLSFPTIAASGPHGAITHYFPTPDSSRQLALDEMFLCDSGAQYADGTTDVTRTMFFGKPGDELVRSFTHVLKGHVGLASAVFPKGSLGSSLDILARLPLWKAGIDYGHGTGHGVGAYLNVHEGPHSISFRRRDNEPALEPGMTTSIEPGYYEQDNYGIRIENICLVKTVEGEHKMGAGVELLTFEPLTLIPFQRKLIDPSLLTHEEKAYLDAYHARVWDTISPLLHTDDDMLALDWLRRNTAPL